MNHWCSIVYKDNRSGSEKVGRAIKKEGREESTRLASKTACADLCRGMEMATTMVWRPRLLIDFPPAFMTRQFSDFCIVGVRGGRVSVSDTFEGVESCAVKPRSGDQKARASIPAAWMICSSLSDQPLTSRSRNGSLF